MDTGRAMRLLEFLLTPSLPVFVLGLLVIILAPVFLHLYLSRSTKYITLPSVMLVGPPATGKTALATLLERRDKPAATHASQTPNVIELAVSEDNHSAPASFRDDLDAAGATARKFLLVDTPGHPKLRGAAALAALAPATAAAAKLRAVVFVVDAAALAETDTKGSSSGLAETAALLYDVLLALQHRMGAGRSSKAPAPIPVLIAANKADLFSALPAALVRSRLEAELSRLRLSRTSAASLLDSSAAAPAMTGGDNAGEDDDNALWLGQLGSASFTFDQMREYDTDIDVLPGNVVGDGPGVDKWWRWIATKIE